MEKTIEYIEKNLRRSEEAYWETFSKLEDAENELKKNSIDCQLFKN
jgi:hypothetical protein